MCVILEHELGCNERESQVSYWSTKIYDEFDVQITNRWSAIVIPEPFTRLVRAAVIDSQVHARRASGFLIPSRFGRALSL